MPGITRSEYGQTEIKPAILSSGFFGLRKNVRVKLKGGTELNYNYNAGQYRPAVRVEYFSDKVTEGGFSPGKWYYNAKNVYFEARKKGIPCLFIYSLWGCGPCAIYQKALWNNADFQDWFKKQKFLLCGLECESQPAYDAHLKFLTDELSIKAQNFVKQDLGEIPERKAKNALNQQFRRFKTGDQFASNLMTPVLVFMDKSGRCYDYTYHNIAADIARLPNGAADLLQQLKSLCLYHFDGNSLSDPKYVVDAGKVFDIRDYMGSATNPWQTLASQKIVDMGKDVAEYGYSGVASKAALTAYMHNKLKAEVPQYAAVATQLHLGGCLFSDIPVLNLIFQPDSGEADVEELVSAADLNRALQEWRFQIGTKYYQMTFSADSISIDNPCGDGTINIFKVDF